MKKLLAAMLTGMLVYGSAFAQTTTAKPECTKTGQVCKSSGTGKTCYATNNAQNYKVCKSKKGYYTCGKKPGETGVASATPTNATSYVVTSNAATAAKTTKVCKPTKRGANADCYNTTYNENFAVCKNYQGYYICGEKANSYNSTFELFPFMNNTLEYQNTYDTKSGLAPENQSYKNMEHPLK